MTAITLANLRTRTRQRANMENSQFISDSELNQMINYGISELHDYIVSKVDNDYFASTQDYTLTSGTEEYSLPASFYKLLEMQIRGDDGYYYKMKRFEYSERNIGANPVNYFTPEIQYRLRGNKLLFTPVNQIGNRSVRLIYVPVATVLVADGDTLEGYNGWDEYVILTTAIKCLTKEEQDVTQLENQLAYLKQRIEFAMDNRDQAAPTRIYDNDRSYGDYRWR